jgi:hypothetical protein
MTDVRVVNHFDVENGLTRIAHGAPEGYIYPYGTGCYNTETNADGEWLPSCIVGKFFVEILGVKAAESWRYGAFNETAARFPQFTFTDEAKFMLRAAQIQQDNGVSWRHIAAVMYDLRRAATEIFVK